MSFPRYLAKRVGGLLAGAGIVLATVGVLMLIGMFLIAYPIAAVVTFIVVCAVGWVCSVYIDYMDGRL